MKRYQFLLVVLFVIQCSLSQAATYYFSSSGSDSYTTAQAQNPETPWQTIDKLNTNMWRLQPGDSVLFKRGDTFIGSLRSILVSGADGMPITFGAYGEGTSKPVLDNRLELTNWINVGGNLWESSTPDISGRPEAMTINDVLKPLGRYPNIGEPNGGYLTITSHPAGSKTTFTDDSLAVTPNWTGAEAVVRNADWVLNRIPVGSHSGQTITLTGSAWYEMKNGYGYFFQNHPATLDSDGEWCYLANENKILLYSTVDPNTDTIKITNINNHFIINSRSNIVIDGISMVGAQNSAVALSNNASNCTIKNCDFLFSGKNAIKAGTASAPCDSITIINNRFEYTQSNCVWLFASRVTIQDNIFNHTGTNPGMAESGQTGVGIHVTGNRLNIEHNTIRNTGYAAIRFSGSDVLIERNVIDNYCLVLDDGGAIYTYKGSPTLPENTNQKIAKNVIVNGIGAWLGTTKKEGKAEGIYLDDNSSNVEIENNTVAFCSSGIFLHNSKKNKVKNNNIYACSKALWLLEDGTVNYPVADCDIQNNIFTSNSIDALSSPLLFYRTRDEANINQIGTMDNNIYCQPFLKHDYIRYQLVPSPLPLQKQLYINLEEWQNFSGKDEHSGTSPVSFPLFSDVLSENKIINGSFEENLDTWKSWNPATNSSILEIATGQLDGGCMSLTVSGTGGENTSLITTDIPPITKGKSYLLKISAKSDVNGSLKLLLMGSSSPFTKGSADYFINVSSARLDKEILITATETLSNPGLYIHAGPEDGTVYLDNLELFEVTPVESDYYVQFEYNSDDIVKNIGVVRNSVTPQGDFYAGGSTVQVPPFGSIVLLKEDPKLFVEDITVGSQKENENSENKKYRGVASVFLADSNGNPVSDTYVKGIFSGDINETVTGLTDAAGQVDFVSTTIVKLKNKPNENGKGSGQKKKKSYLEFEFCVDSVFNENLAYEPDMNAITCLVFNSDSVSSVNGLKGADIAVNDYSENEFMVYPNPFQRGDLVIRYNGEVDNQAILKVLNISGQIVYKTQMVQPETSLNRNSLPKGVFVVILESNGTLLGKSKLVVQ